MSTFLPMSRIRMASWPCWTRSAWGRGQSPMRPSWTNWTPSVLSTSTLRVASARIQSSSPTTACRTVASASSTMPARYWTLICVQNNEGFVNKMREACLASAVKGLQKTITDRIEVWWIYASVQKTKFLMYTQSGAIIKTKTKYKEKN